MLAQTSLPRQKAPLLLQVQACLAGSSQNVAAQRTLRLLWTGLGFGVLMLIGISASALVPLASHAPATAAHDAPAVAVISSQLDAFIPSHLLPELSPGSSRPATTGFLPGSVPPGVVRPAGSIAMIGEYPKKAYTSGDPNMMNMIKSYGSFITKKYPGEKPSNAASKMTGRDQAMRPSGSHKGSFRARTPTKTQVNVYDVLADWAMDASMGTLDVNREMLMANTLEALKRLQDETEAQIDGHHVLGLVLPRKVPTGSVQDRISALASVFVEPLEPGTEVPVVYISDLIANPKEPLDGAGADLVDGIVAWATEMGRLVTIKPSSISIERYYESLGFRHVDTDASTMVYVGHVEKEDTLRPGLLLDLNLSKNEDPKTGKD